MAASRASTVHDVIVVGGGAAGVGAAVGAANAGARTLLLEASGSLGGAASLRGVHSYCGVYTLGDEPRQVVGGVGADVFARLRAAGALTGPHRFRGVFLAFDPEVNKRVLDEVCLEAGVDIGFHSTVVAADRVEDRLTGVTVHTNAVTRRCTADAFVDASGDANLAVAAGAAVRLGNDGQVNLGSLATRFGGIDPETEVTAEQLQQAIDGIEAAGGGPLTKRSGVVIRLPGSGDVCVYLASADDDATDADRLSAAEIEGRRQAVGYLEAIRRIEGCEQARLVSTGPHFGVRESRHVVSPAQLSWADVAGRRRFDDAVALGAWGAEWHDRSTWRSSFELPPDGGAYEIPLVCLRSADTRNLFAAGRCVDGDRLGGAAVRVMGTAFATGQAAGVAAAVGGDVTQVAMVQDQLRRQGAVPTLGDLG